MDSSATNHPASLPTAPAGERSTFRRRHPLTNMPDVDTLQVCISQITRLLERLDIQSKGTGDDALQAIESACQEIDASRDKLITALWKIDPQADTCAQFDLTA